MKPPALGKASRIGQRAEDRSQSEVSLWYLGIDSELVFVGDAGTTDAGRPSRRVGVEWTNYWRLRP
jgi:hypothetical protein